MTKTNIYLKLIINILNNYYENQVKIKINKLNLTPLFKFVN